MRGRIEAGDKVDIVCRAGQEGAAVGWLIEHDRADMVLGHCTSGKTAQAATPDLAMMPLLKELSAGATDRRRR